MSLPHPDLAFAPKTTLSAADLNKLVANDRALANGEGMSEGRIEGKHLKDSTVPIEKIKMSSFDIREINIPANSNIGDGGTTVATFDLAVGRRYLILFRAEFRNEPQRQRQVFTQISGGTGFNSGRNYKVIKDAYFDEISCFCAGTVTGNGRVSLIVGCDQGQPATIVGDGRSKAFVIMIG